MARNSECNTYTDERGKFAPENPDKPKGTRNKATRAVQGLLDEDSGVLTRKAVELALEGDTAALSFRRWQPAHLDGPRRVARSIAAAVRVGATQAGRPALERTDR